MPVIVKDIKYARENQGGAMSKAESRRERDRRLARALRENLKRRKEQRRERQTSEAPKPADTGKKSVP
jgi:hypothetical protein